jgi:peptide/nickel transport system substrate-binding protein
MNRSVRFFYGVAIFTILASLGTAVFAQKSKDTIRVPFNSPLSTIDFFYDPGQLQNMWADAFYDGLVNFDPDTGKFAPNLAQSWSRVNETTLEFDLREDVTWHDGERFDADDVVHIINWLVDPKVVLRLKENWAFFEGAEKLGPYRVRIRTNQATPFDLMRLAYGTHIYPEHVHAPLDNKEKFGQSPIGTGPLKALLVDKNRGIEAARSERYNRSSKTKPAATIGRVVAPFIPDLGAQIAHMQSDGVDVLWNIDAEQAELLGNDGRFEVTLDQGLNYMFLGIPGQGRRNVPALADARVRRAIAMAIDRETLQRLAAGGAKPERAFEAICWKVQLGCGYTKTTPAFDPAAAKRLLAEAGYPNGFDVEVVSFTGAQAQLGQAAVGMLRAVGIRASLRAVPIIVARNLERDGKLQVMLYGWGGGGMFDASGAMVRHFLRPEYDDPVLTELAQKTMGIMDDTERRSATAKAIDYSIDQAHLFPMISNPRTIVHRKEVKVAMPVMRPNGPFASDFAWK